MHPSQHFTHWFSWFGSVVAVHGYWNADRWQQDLGIATAVLFSIIGSVGYLRAAWDSWQLRREAKHAAFRREQELLDAEMRIKIDRITQERAETK